MAVAHGATITQEFIGVALYLTVEEARDLLHNVQSGNLYLPELEEEIDSGIEEAVEAADKKESE